MRLLSALVVAACFAAVPAHAHAQEPTPMPEPTPVLAPLAPQGQTWNLISGEVVPLIVIDYFQLEYERVLSPSLGGIAIRGRADYLYLGVFSLGDIGAGVH